MGFLSLPNALIGVLLLLGSSLKGEAANHSIRAEEDEFLIGQFPDGFQFGVATSAYQIEGAWDVDGKGESIWDEFVHRIPSVIHDGYTGDIACDSYHHNEDDVELMKAMGINFYRFSIAWTRVIPTGKFLEGTNDEGIAYYNDFIDLLLANNIEPIVTMYHWDLPQKLQEEYGGWPSEELITHFKDYANLLYSTYGDRVKKWITFNEPWVVCIEGYSSGVMAPGHYQDAATEPYQCAHTIIQSHAEAYNLYKETYAATQQGIVGITLDSSYYQAADENNAEDVVAAERAQQFKLGWFASPIVHGNYPEIMIEKMEEKGREAGLKASRLPTIDDDLSNKIKGTFDFLGLNHYTTSLVKHAVKGTEDPPKWENDQDCDFSQDLDWPGSSASWLRTVPWGFRKLLNWMKAEYNNPEIMITENGYADFPETGVHDTGRVFYFTHYINNLLKAVVVDEVHVTAYAAWSLLDNFEWARGYSERFGVHRVDFADENRHRTPKDSATLLTKIYKDRGFLELPPTTTTTLPPTPEPTTTPAPTTTTGPTGEPTTEGPTTTASTGGPTTGGPTTGEPTTGGPTTGEPTTGGPTTGEPTTGGPTTGEPTTGGPTTGEPTTGGPTTTNPPTTTTGGSSVIYLSATVLQFVLSLIVVNYVI